MTHLPTLDDGEFKGKTVIVRVDINSPCEVGVLTSDKRILAHWDTLFELSESGARTVVLGHQGRPGKHDFISLWEHVKILEEKTGKHIEFVEDIMGSAAREKIKKMNDGDILFLDNVRFLAEERLERDPAGHAQSNLVKRLAPLADAFVGDCFSVSHRSHASVVGFTYVLPSYAGRLMEREVKATEKVLEKPEQPCVLVFGGVKADDSIRVMENVLRNGGVNKALTCGLVGELFMVAGGIDIGDPNMDTLKKTGVYDFLGRAQSLLKRYPEKIAFPSDVAVTVSGERINVKAGETIVDMIKDIGDETIKEYSKILRKAKTICMNGPAGVYENPVFAKGTKEIFSAVKDAKGFSLLGGGHTSSAISTLDFKFEDFSYVSLAGGALITQLSGDILPGVEAIKRSPSTKKPMP